MSALVDTHCHLDLFKDIQNDPTKEDHLGIKTISVTNAPSFFAKNKDLFAQSKNIRVALGLHPQLVATHASEYNQFRERVNETRYVGEIGLDGSSEYKSSYLMQAKLFENILLCIKNGPDKVLTIHSRNASKETIDMLTKVLGGTKHRIILHWYSGGKSEFDIAIRHGFYFSVNHKMCFSDKGKALIGKMPLNRMLTETDAPFTYTTSINSRLKSLKLTLQEVAKLKGLDEAECADRIFTNFKDIIKS